MSASDPIGEVDRIVERRERHAALARTPSLRARILGQSLAGFPQMLGKGAAEAATVPPIAKPPEVIRPPKPAPSLVRAVSLPPPQVRAPRWRSLTVPKPYFERVLWAVCKAFCITAEEFYLDARPRRLAYPRIAVTGLLRRRNYSFPSIAHWTRRDPSTTLSQAGRCVELYAESTEFRSKYTAALALLGEQS